jgi:hypothetical protein
MTSQAPGSIGPERPPRKYLVGVPRMRHELLTLAARCLTLPATRAARCVTRQRSDSRTIGLFVTLVYPLVETPCVKRTTFLPGDTTAKTSGSRRSCGIFVIGPLALSAGAENYAKPLRRLSSPISLAVFSSLVLSPSQLCRALKSRVKEL